MNLPSVYSRRRPVIIAAVILAGLVLLYALVGALLLPWLAKRELPRMAAEKLGVHARVEAIAFNPFTLRLRVTGLVLEDSGARPLLRWREAEANMEWRSLARRAVVLSELRLQEPVAHLEISEKGRLNFAALGGRSDGEAEKGGAPGFSVGHVAVENGRIEFEDRREGYRNSFEHLSLNLSSISTLRDERGPYDLVAQTPDGGTLRWKGEISIAPLELAGTLSIEHAALSQLNPYLDGIIRGRIAGGQARIDLPHRFALVSGEPGLTIKDAKISVEGLALATSGAEKPFTTVASLKLDGIDADLKSRRASVRTARVAGFSVAARRDAQGALDLAGLLLPSREAPSGTPWRFEVGEADFSDGTASFADEATGLALTLQRMTAKLGDVSSDTTQPLAFEAGTELSGGGRIAVRGKGVPAEGSLEAHLETSGVPIALLQPLLARHADVKLASGTLSLAGELRAGAPARTRRGKTAQLTYSGAAALEQVAVQDGKGAPVIGWNSMSTNSLRLSLGPNAARMDELRWVAPKGKLEIAADGTTNLHRLFDKNPESAPAAPAPGATPGADPDSDQPDEAGEFTVRIRRVQVDHGTLDFADRSLSPNFSAVIHELKGTLNGISTDRNTRSQFALEGQVNEFGYARLSGTLNPFAPRSRTSFRVQFRNLEVARVSPYTIKFAGYRVASGRMSLDLNYRVADNRIEGDNQIVLDDFTLGEHVEGTDAPKVPLELAVSLLKDPDGRIDIAVPISGSLDDPNFRLGDIFWKALGNIVRNIVTAPFRALGHLFGKGSEQLAAISFEPGASRLLPPEREKLKRIADGLARRPDLKLVIPARYDTEADGAALRREALRRELGRRAGFDIGADDAAGPLSIEDRRTRRALRELFAERFTRDELDRLKSEAEKQAAGGKAGDLSIGERLSNFVSGEPQVADPSAFYRTLFRRLLEAQPLADDALAALAQQRAEAVASGIQAIGLDPARISRTSAEPASTAGAKQVTLQLGLAPSK